jgi:hypothetical protein
VREKKKKAIFLRPLKNKNHTTLLDADKKALERAPSKLSLTPQKEKTRDEELHIRAEKKVLNMAKSTNLNIKEAFLKKRGGFRKNWKVPPLILSLVLSFFVFFFFP